MTGASGPDPVIRIQGLSRRFGARQALREVSLTVERGQVFGIVGENGAGKTTLIKHILGLYRPQCGRLRVFGQDPVREPESVLGRIGYLSEDPDLPGWMTVDALLRYMAAFYATWDTGYAEELIGLFEIDRRATVANLSKGQRAKVGLCVAQAHRPDLLLLDEPSSGLDPVVRRDILSTIIRTVADEGRTVVFSSHLLDEVERVSDHLMMLSRGEILLSDSMDNVLTKHHRVTVKVSGPTRLPDRIDGVINASFSGGEWHLDYYGELDRIEHELARRGTSIVTHRSLSLNDVFLVRSQGPRDAMSASR